MLWSACHEASSSGARRRLSIRHVDQFVEEGFVRIDNAFPRAIADAGLAALWQAVGCDADDPATWTRPVVGVWPENDQEGTQPIAFREAATTPVLYDAFDKFAGRGRWKPRPNVGTFVARFPWMKRRSADPARPGRA